MLRTILFLLLFPLSAFGQYIGTIVGTGAKGSDGDQGWAPLATLTEPGSIMFDRAGNMYIADNSYKIRKINSSGIITTFAGNGIMGHTADGHSVTSSSLNALGTGVTIDASDNIYVSDNNQIRKISATGIISTIAGNGSYGDNGDNIPALSAKLNFPILGTVDHAGNIFFSDYGNYRVRKVNAAGIVTNVAGNGTVGYSGDGGPATDAQIKAPIYTTLSPSGDIYIPERANHCVRKVDMITGIITTFAGNGSLGNSGDGGPATAAQLSDVESIAFDNKGNVFLADYGANVIRKVNPVGVISTYAGTGMAGFSGDGGLASVAELNGPLCICYHTDGCLYVSDWGNNRIRKICPTPIEVKEVRPDHADVRIYPSPAQSELTVSSGGVIDHVQVIDAKGSTALTLTGQNKHEVVLYVAALPGGIYFVLVNGAYAGRFVKE